MHTLGDMAVELKRKPVVVGNLQSRFELPLCEGAGYSPAYLACLRTFVWLRMFNVSWEALEDLWHLEKKLLQLLHADSSGSPTWFLDACGQTSHRRRRLLLTNYDLGVDISGHGLQLGLDFAHRPAELFAGQDMGEDALRILNDYLTRREGVLSAMATEASQLRAALGWATALALPHTPLPP